MSLLSLYRGRVNPRRFLERETGSITVEMVLWLPFIMGLMAFITNVTMVMHTQTLLYDAARDSAREVATNNATSAEAIAKLRHRFPEKMQVDADVTVAEGFVTSTLTARYNGVIGLGLSLFDSSDVRASVTMWMELDDEA